MLFCPRMRRPGARRTACPLSVASAVELMTNAPRKASCGKLRWACAAAGATKQTAVSAARAQRYMVLIQWLLRNGPVRKKPCRGRLVRAAGSKQREDLLALLLVFLFADESAFAQPLQGQQTLLDVVGKTRIARPRHRRHGRGDRHRGGNSWRSRHGSRSRRHG